MNRIHNVFKSAGNLPDLDIIVISTLGRLILGIALGALFGFMGWLVDLWIFQFVAKTPVILSTTVIVTVSVMVTAGVYLAWWNWETRWKVKFAQIGTIFGLVLISSTLTYFVSSNYAGFIWFERGILFNVINVAVLIATVLALGMYLHRVIWAREV